MKQITYHYQEKMFEEDICCFIIFLKYTESCATCNEIDLKRKFHEIKMDKYEILFCYSVHQNDV